MRRRGGDVVKTGIDDNAGAEHEHNRGNQQGGDNSAHGHPPSEPSANAEHEAHVARALARLPRKIRRLSEFSLIDDAEIGGECTAELVAQPEAGIDIGKPGADQAGRVRLAVEVQFDLRLQDKPLREQEVVGGLQLASEMAFAADKAGNLEIEEIRREALNAEGGPVARRP